MPARSRTPYRFGVVTGAAMLLGSLLGPGALALPALAAHAAGPAPLAAWAALLAASVPIALTFATLGARHPGGGGISGFAAHAFGDWAAGPVGWWFYAAVPIGVAAAGIIGARYLAAAAAVDTGWVRILGAAFVVAGLAANVAGLRASGRSQVVSTVLLVALLATTIVTSASRVDAAAFTPFAPRGWTAVGAAAALLFYAFSGWEAATHLSAQFGSGTTVLRATVVALLVVTVLYLGLAVLTIGLDAGQSSVPLLTFLRGTFGPAGTVLTAGAAVALTFGAINGYLASGIQLGAALGRARTVPLLSTPVGPDAGWSGRSVLTLTCSCALVVAATALAGLQLDTLVRATSALLGAVTLAGTLAGARLLTGGARVGALLASVLVALVLVSCGWMLLLPVALAAGAALYGRRVAAVERARASRSPRAPERHGRARRVAARGDDAGHPIGQSDRGPEPDRVERM
ncbi:APC family permease [Cellulomonas alba]|uniref:APC family permease n=1 Tax=Cellulomonas alba TaxID=3053467 RepID=A0ABT7SF88_9CELL|nr:APC family permease [Cellulomonas alba]MDM7854791.1 APC family permease [Cellulomonas alba]